MTETWSAEPEDIAKVLIGRRVVRIDEDAATLTLDNGTKVVLEDGGDCCAWFSAAIKEIDLDDNLVTGYRVEDIITEDEGDGEFKYVMHVLSNNKNLADITIEGYPGSGYYGSSINMIVKEIQA